MKKNTAGQKFRVFAFNRNTGVPVTGDALAITAKLSIDYGTRNAIADTNPTESEDGYYDFDLTQGETNGYRLDIYPESSTSGVQVIGVPGVIFTADADNLLDFPNAVDGKTLRQALRIMAAVLAGKVSGAGSGTENFRVCSNITGDC